VNSYDQSSIAVEKGISELEIKLDNQFLPGKYYLDLTIALPNGEAIDSIENALEFSVSNLGATPELNYNSTVVNGYVSGKASWLMK